MSPGKGEKKWALVVGAPPHAAAGDEGNGFVFAEVLPLESMAAPA